MHGHQANAVIAGFLRVLAIALPIGIVIGAVFLRIAISIFNKLASEPLDEPTFGSAMLVSLARFAANLGVILAFSGVSPLVFSADANSLPLMLGVSCFAVIIQLAINAWIFSVMQPTDMAKASLVSLIEFLINIGIAIVIGSIIFAVTAATGGRF